MGEDKLRADPGENIKDYFSLDGGKGLEFLQQHRRARNIQEIEFSPTRRNVLGRVLTEIGMCRGCYSLFIDG